MIGKHIDLVAIALLLFGAGIYTGTRQLAGGCFRPVAAVALTQAVQRALHCNQTATAKHRVTVQKVIVIPETPAAAHISISTD